MKNKARWFWLAVRALVMGSVLQIAVPAMAASHWEAQPTVDKPPFGTVALYDHVTAAKDGWLYTFSIQSSLGYPGIARWSKMTGWEWVATMGDAGNSYAGTIYAMVISGNSLYFGGNFDNVTMLSGEVNVTNIARLDLTTLKCYPVGNGVISNYAGLGSLSGNNFVQAITVDKHTNVYVAVNTIDAQPPPIYQPNPTPILKCNTNGTWVELGNGLYLGPPEEDMDYLQQSGQVFGLANDGTDVFACGKFLGGTNSDGSYVPSGGIIKWTGTNWQTMGPTNTVQGIAVGGIYDPIIADATFFVNAVAVSGTNVFVTGTFIGYPCNPLPVPPPDCQYSENSSVGPSLARFSTAGALLQTDVMELNGSTYSGCIGFDLAAQPNGTVYLVGQFDHLDGAPLNGLAQWTASTGWGMLDPVNGDLNGNRIWSLAVDANNAVYVLGSFTQAGGIPIEVDQSESDQIARWVTGSNPDHLATISTYIGTSAGLSCPLGINFDKVGDLYIADTGNHQIFADYSGTFYTILNYVQGLSTPTGIAVDSGWDLFVSDGDWGGLLEFVSWPDNPDYIIGGPNNATLSVVRTSGGSIYSGYLYSVNEYGNTVSRMTPGPYTSTTVVAGNGTAGSGGDNGPATQASLRVSTWFFINSGYNVIFPSATLDSHTNLYIADMSNSVVRMVANSNQYIYLVAGSYSMGYSGDGGPATSAQLVLPAAVAVDSNSGNIYIADAGTNVIRKVDATGTISTLAGTGQRGYTGDGGPAINATLNTPAGLTLDGSGNLYISDTGNNVIRVIGSP